MSYHRMGKYRGLAGFDDVVKSIGSSIGSVGGGVLDILGTPQSEAGRAEALLETQKILAAQQAAGGAAAPGDGIGKYLPYLLIGGGVLAIVLFMKKKGSAS